MKPRPRYMVLLISLAILLLGTAIGTTVMSNSGSVIVNEYDIQSADEATIHCTLQTPTYATSLDPLPGVLMIHGSLQSKEWVMAFGIELSRRGFVVLTIDANGHGDSDAGSSTLGSVAALEHLAGLDVVDSNAIGIIGHSMGGGHAWRALDNSTVHVSSIVLVGAGVANVTTISYIPNMLVTVGDFDSLSSYPRDTSKLEPSFNVSPVEPGVTYGDFSTETARRLFVARTNHLFETIDSTIVSESVEWMKNSLKGGVEDSHWIPSNELVFQTWLFGGLLSLIGAVLTIFPMMAILLDMPFLKDIKQKPELLGGVEKEKSNTKYGLLFGILGLALFYPLMAVGTILNGVVYIPMANGTPIVTWLLGTGLIVLLVFKWILKRGSIPDISVQKLAGTDNGFKPFISKLIRPGILALIIVIWLYAWTAVVDIWMVLDIRVFLPGLNLLTPTRTLFMFLFFVVFLVYFYVEGIWLVGTIPTSSKTGWFSTQVDWTLKAILVKSLPYLIILGIEFGGGLLTGTPIVPGYIGYTFLFFYAFTPWFIVATIVTMWSYRMTNDYRTGAFLNAMISAWLIATILSFPSWLV